jgi:DNA-binding Lrp family transcriptional regulator
MSTAAEEDLSDVERAGLELIRETGGIHQSEFWKELDVDSRKGSRIIDKLEDRELVEREDTVYNGHNTYHITPVRDPRDLEFSLLMAGDMLSPFVGDEEIDPQSDAFSQWVMTLAYEEY